MSSMKVLWPTRSPMPGIKRGVVGLIRAVLAGYVVMTYALAIYVLNEAVKDVGKSSKEG